MAEINGVFQVPDLSAWQGSYNTGGPAGRRKKKEEQHDEETDSSSGDKNRIVEDEDGQLHVDLEA